jgi:hypothetical protein
MLTWETNQPPELKGPHRYDEKQGAVRILLDGQQRVTTLYMLIRDKIPPYYTLPDITNDTRGLYVHVETRELEYYSRGKMEKDPCWQNLTDTFQRKVRAKDMGGRCQCGPSPARCANAFSLMPANFTTSAPKRNRTQFAKRCFRVDIG